MKQPIKHLMAALTITVLFISCKKDEQNPAIPGSEGRAVFVVNEGSFGSGNGSLTFIDLQTGSAYQDAFQTVNGFPLGDVAQSMSIHNGRGYVMVNVSGKVEVIDATSLQSIATITGLMGPRYFVAKGTKGYVSDWFSNSIAVIDLNTNSITNNIVTGEGPEQMIIYNNKLFVTNVGGWNNDSTVTVINLDTETVDTTLVTGLNPNSIKKDASGKLWILSGGSIGPDFTGGTADDIAGSLRKINPETYETEITIAMNQDQHPSKLQTNGIGTELYFLSGSDGYNGKVVKMLINATSLPSGYSINREFYGLGIDPVTGIIYCGQSTGFSSNGFIHRYNSTFTLIDSIPSGIAPNGFCFR